jgi:hypothetical protein
MKKILDFLTFGHHVLVHAPVSVNNATVENLCGFQILQSLQLGSGTNQLLAPNGETYDAANLKFSFGSGKKLLLCKDTDDSAGIFCSFDRDFPEQNIVIATDDDKLAFFAPICNNDADLADFILMLDEFFIRHQRKMPCDAYDNFTELALWLYRHNANN